MTGGVPTNTSSSSSKFLCGKNRKPSIVPISHYGRTKQSYCAKLRCVTYDEQTKEDDIRAFDENRSRLPMLRCVTYDEQTKGDESKLS
jgi:hypothetical protein